MKQIISYAHSHSHLQEVKKLKSKKIDVACKH